MKALLILSAFVVTTLSACSSYNYSSVSIKKVNSSVFKTYAWLPEARPSTSSYYDNDIASDKIVDAASAELNKRGFVMSNQDPDLLIKYMAGVDNKTVTYNDPVYYSAPWSLSPRFGYYRGRSAFYYSYANPYPIYVDNSVTKLQIKEGSIIIDIIERKTSKLIWRGWAQGDLSSEEKAIEDIPNVVDQIFKKLSAVK